MTVAARSDGFYEEKRSRFLASVYPCGDARRAAQLVADARSEYWDARHHVYAWILRDGSSRFSDDGEPHGTAGKPVFDLLSAAGLIDTAVIVTRYFGGTLLGTGGLVRAYSAAARAALENAQRVLMCPCVRYEVVCPYAEHRLLERLIGDCGGNLAGCDFGADVTLNAVFRTADAPLFLQKVREAFSARLCPRELGTEYSAFPVKK